MLRNLEDAHSLYLRAVREIQVSHQSACARAQRDHDAAVQECEGRYRERASAAAEAYQKQQAGADEPDLEAYDAYTAEVNDAWSAAQSAMGDAQSAHRDASCEAWAVAAESYREAFAAAVRGLQEAVASVSPDEVTPQMLTQAAQMIHTTASCASGTPPPSTSPPAAKPKPKAKAAQGGK